MRLTVAALAAGLALGGCGRDTGSDEPTGGAAAEEKGTIGISMQTKSSERWIADVVNMAEQFLAKG